MAFWEAIVLIVLIGSVSGVLSSYFKAKQHAAPPADPAAGAAQDEVRQLRERIQVLERVITDNHGSKRLDDEIERLRDR